jgi:hypothetical protein
MNLKLVYFYQKSWCQLSQFRSLQVQEIETTRTSRQPAHEGGKVSALRKAAFTLQEISQRLLWVGGLVDPWALVRPGGGGKRPVTSTEIKPATFQVLGQCHEKQHKHTAYTHIIHTAYTQHTHTSYTHSI